MPRDHGRILSRIWQDKDFRQLTEAAQRLYFLLLSQANVNNAGVLPLQVFKWAKGCDHTTPDDIRRALNELAGHRYVLFDDDTEEALIRSYIRNDGVMKQPNIFKNALRCCEATESTNLRAALASELRLTRRKDAATVADRITNPSETLEEPFSNPSETLSNGETLSEPFRIPAGRGKGKGEGEPCVGGSVGEHAPPPHCPAHMPDGTEKACRPCGEYRRRREEWDGEQAQTKADRERAERESAAQSMRDCRACDEAGWLLGDDGTPVEPSRRCNHRELS